jgi:hypothetical protein
MCQNIKCIIFNDLSVDMNYFATNLPQDGKKPNARCRSFGFLKEAEKMINESAELSVASGYVLPVHVSLPGNYAEPR